MRCHRSTLYHQTRIILQFPQLLFIFLLISSATWKRTTDVMALSSCSSPPPSPHRRLALLDRDGIINEDVGSPGVLDPSQLQLTPHAAQAVGNLCRHGYKVVMITNQGCVGKKLITRQKLDEIQDCIQKMLLQEDDDAVIHRIYQCTSTKDDNDPRSKPSPGMILEAFHDYDNEHDDLGDNDATSTTNDNSLPSLECFMIGDALRDLEAATRGGVPLRFLVSTGYGLSIMKDHVPSAPNVNEAILVDTKTFERKGTENEVLSSVMPFYYVKNLASAVEYVLSTLEK